MTQVLLVFIVFIWIHVYFYTWSINITLQLVWVLCQQWAINFRFYFSKFSELWNVLNTWHKVHLNAIQPNKTCSTNNLSCRNTSFQDAGQKMNIFSCFQCMFANGFYSMYFQNSLTKQPQHTDSPGRSGASMLMSYDKRYFIKTLVSEEVEQMHHLLKQYHQVNLNTVALVEDLSAVNSIAVQLTHYWC